MSYFVIGLSGVTCGGKTTMSKLLQRSFPWAKVIHQDKYFKPEEHEDHVKLPEIDNHINFDIYTALDMDQMHKDVAKILNSAPEEPTGQDTIIPNFAEGLELLRNLEDIGELRGIPSKNSVFGTYGENVLIWKIFITLDLDTSRFSHIPILIIEGFIIYESEFLNDKCDVRFFLTLDEETCRRRRTCRTFDPPDGPGYFDHCIWPEYQHHYKNFVEDRAGIQVYSGRAPIAQLWRDSVELVGHKIEEKYPYKINMAANNNC